MLFCQNKGERFIHTVNYDNTSGQLKKPPASAISKEEKTDLTHLLMRDTHKVYLNGVNRQISKPEFLQKIDRIPMFTNLLRAETLFQDWNISLLKQQKPLNKRVIVFLVSSEIQF